MENVTVILPSLNPDEKLNMVIGGLLREGFTDIVIVNDGSDEAHMEPFKKAALHKEVTVLTHEVNKGKGRALKTAFSYVLENRKDIAGVVTVDGDNQHTSHDIKACAEKMCRKGKVILGCRNFNGPDVPFKSKFGNVLTSSVFRLFCGIKLSDTQTGLRAIPAGYLPLLCEVAGERFEYETEMLLVFRKNNIAFEEQEIKTVYLEENVSTHFHPVKDSIRIYKIIFKFMLSSGASFLIDYCIFVMLVYLLEGVIGREQKLLIATVTARAFSSLFNYTMNRKAVFGSKSSVKSSIIKYYTLCVVQTSVSYGAVYLFSVLCSAGPFMESIFKLIVDVCLFFLSFRIQQRWVFR